MKNKTKHSIGICLLIIGICIGCFSIFLFTWALVNDYNDGEIVLQNKIIVLEERVSYLMSKEIAIKVEIDGTGRFINKTH